MKKDLSISVSNGKVIIEADVEYLKQKLSEYEKSEKLELGELSADSKSHEKIKRNLEYLKKYAKRKEDFRRCALYIFSKEHEKRIGIDKIYDYLKYKYQQCSQKSKNDIAQVIGGFVQTKPPVIENTSERYYKWNSKEYPPEDSSQMIETIAQEAGDGNLPDINDLKNIID